jgi:serine/threonine protein kinase
MGGLEPIPGKMSSRLKFFKSPHPSGDGIMYGTAVCITMAEFQAREETQFRLIKCIEDNVWLAERISDNEPFIARRLDEFDLQHGEKNKSKAEKDRTWHLLKHQGMIACLAQILNHENIISIAGFMNAKPLLDNSEHLNNTWIAWDFCDAGNLETVMTDNRLLAEWSRSPHKLMPEALCWHVLMAMLRALVWLHDGKRLVDTPNGKVLESVDVDWMPILHGNISPHNIHFQHPRGRETFGVCKLANFSTAFVSGKLNMYGTHDNFPNPTPYDQSFHEGGIAAGLRSGKAGSLAEIRCALDRDPVLPPVSWSRVPQRHNTMLS